MQKSIVNINGVPTYVSTWGAGIEEDLKHVKDIVICITGNPGVTGFYNEFLETIHGGVRFPVWVLSHAGHEIGPDLEIPSSSRHPELYSLEGQVQHKIAFVKKYVPSHVNIHFIGHSIGCYIILQMLKRDSEIKALVKKAYFLFPCVERMKETPNGKLFTNFIKYIVPVIVFLAWVFTLFPPAFKSFLLASYFAVRRLPKHTMMRPTTKLINPRTLRNVFSLAFDELVNVRELDHDTVEENSDKLIFYYGNFDGWCPLSYYEDMKTVHPQVYALTTNYDHAFVMKSSRDVAYLVIKWIKSDTLANKEKSL